MKDTEKELWDCFTFKDNKWLTGVTTLGLKKQHLTIPEGVVGINTKAFKNCKNRLLSVVIPTSVKTIGEHIFSRCNNLKNVINHSTVLFDWWGKNHEYDSKVLPEMKEINFENITNSDGKPFTKIMPGVFQNARFQCDKIYIGSSMKKIGEFNFLDCPNLTYLEIGENIELLGRQNFCSAPILESKNLISHSPVLFDWWVENHKYGDKTLSEMETIDLDKYTNSDGKPFTILATDSLKCCFNLKNLLFGTKFKRINTESVYGWNGVIKNIQIANKKIAIERYAFEHLPPFTNFYVSDELLREKIQMHGIENKRIFVKPIPMEELKTEKNKETSKVEIM